MQQAEEIAVLQKENLQQLQEETITRSALHLIEEVLLLR